MAKPQAPRASDPPRPTRRTAKKPDPRIQLEAQARFRARLFKHSLVWLTVLGLLLCAGQAIRLGHVDKQARRLGRELNGLFVSVLGPEPGASPFGRLQFEQGRMRLEGTRDVNALGLLAALSRVAPPSLRVESIGLARNDGSVICIVDEEDSMFKYLDELARTPAFAFELGGYERREEGVRFELHVEPR